MLLVLLNNLRIVSRGGDTSLFPRVFNLECKFFVFIILFFNVVKFSGIETLQTGSVVLWTRSMDQNLPFSFALSIFPSHVCFRICADPKEKFTYSLWRDLLTSTGSSIHDTDAFNNKLSRVLNTKAKQHLTASERLQQEIFLHSNIA